MFRLVFCFLILKYVESRTMVLVRGVPDPSTSYATTILAGVSFDECLARCYSDDFCLVSYGNIESVCYLYLMGDILKIKTEETGDDQVGIKVQGAFTTCPLTASDLFEGVENTFDANVTTSYQILTKETPGYYRIKYKFGYETSSECSDLLSYEPDCSNMEIVTQPLTYSEAWYVEKDLGSDGKMTIPNAASLSLFNEALLSTGVKDGLYMVGLRRHNILMSWKWDIPELALDSTGISWGVDQPNVYE
uniref:CW domain-containing protein n=1 Tax=Caenorhabditis tropicalis TaxID=1561998 RepID=A0A1I7UGB9_9PELO